MVPNPKWFIKRGNLDTGIHREKAMWRDTERPGTDPSLMTLIRNQSCWWHIDFGLAASKTVRRTFLLLTTPICGTLLWQPQETNTVTNIFLLFPLSYPLKDPQIPSNTLNHCEATPLLCRSRHCGTQSPLVHTWHCGSLTDTHPPWCLQRACAPS